MVNIVIGAFALGSMEVVLRAMFPEARRGAIIEKLGREKNTWERSDAEFHHVGDGIYKLRFPTTSDMSRKRVMIVGDSFVMGHGVGEDGRFGAFLQRNLGPKIEVNVLATSSYSPVIYRNIVRKALSLARYTAVAVFVDQTDPADDLIYQEDLLADGSSGLFNLNLMQNRALLIDQLYNGMLEELSGWKGMARRFTVVNILKPLSIAALVPADNEHYRYIHLSYVDRSPLIKEFEVAPDSAATRRMEGLLFLHFDEIVSLCQEYGVALFWAANPWEYQTSKEPRKGQIVPGPYARVNRLEHIIMERYRERAGVYVIPLTEAFRRHLDPSSLFIKEANEIHWNREGHALVEQVLRESLLQHVGGLIGQ